MSVQLWHAKLNITVPCRVLRHIILIHTIHSQTKANSRKEKERAQSESEIKIKINKSQNYKTMERTVTRYRLITILKSWCAPFIVVIAKKNLTHTYTHTQKKRKNDAP